MRRGSLDILKALIPDKKLASQVGPSAAASVDPDPGRIHPLLPTVNYAWAHPNKVYSDHLPRGGKWKPLETAPPLQFRSWNVMGNGASGFDQGRDGDFLDVKDEKQARFARIATTIHAWQNENVDFIALQEVGKSERKILLEKLGLKEQGLVGGNDEWGYVADANCFTLYRKSVLTLPESKNSTDFLYKDQPIQIHNAYIGHRNFPGKYHDEKIQGKLSATKPSIMLGDFNCRFGPTLKSVSSLFTVVTSKFFRSSKKQGGDHVDAALVRDDKGISQLETWVIDPATGKEYEAPPPAAVRESSVDADLATERKRYSPVMEESWMKGTLDKVRNDVKEDYNISVFMAFNNERDPKIALQFKDRFLYALYKAALTPEDKVICYDYPQGTNEKTMHMKEDKESCVFIDHPQLRQFQEKIASAYSQMDTIKKMFPEGTVFSITASTPEQSGALSLEITPPGKPVISIPVDSKIMENLSSHTKTDTSASTLRSHHN